ncbi:MAG: hypothetical protein ACK4SY_10040 [Pyrobaculum sp.]
MAAEWLASRALFSLPFIPMFVKHLWTAYYAPRGRYPSGIYAKAIALYELFFYLWALTRPGPLFPLVAVMAVIHLIGVPLYFVGYLSRLSKYGRHYGLFEAAELTLLAALLAMS